MTKAKPGIASNDAPPTKLAIGLKKIQILSHGIISHGHELSHPGGVNLGHKDGFFISKEDAATVLEALEDARRYIQTDQREDLEPDDIIVKALSIMQGKGEKE